ncbi:MAG: hypothetical protein MK105_08635 [Crocinitomicaceae bacterium]|nr:hypothetical protein [Crocinitomicaceae bacterium]
MNDLNQNFLASTIFIFLSLSVFSQSKTKKYIRKNKKVEVINYGDSSTYARGLLYYDGRLFIGNSDGTIVFHKPETRKSQTIFHQERIDEIRDIETSDGKILAMHSGDNGKIISIDLNGNTKIIAPQMWNGVFLDGMDFIDNRGFMMGDPVNGVFSLFHTQNGGNSWEPCKGKIKAEKGEAGFAASGTNVQMLNDSTYAFVSGGMKSRFFKSTNNGESWRIVDLPYYPGESTGAYSMHFMNDSIGVIVGGDYLSPELKNNISFYTEDGGESWYNMRKPVRGYRSCVFSKNGVYYSSGRNGIDFSIDDGKSWNPFANGQYFSLTASKTHLIATTRYGSIQLFELIKIK